MLLLPLLLALSHLRRSRGCFGLGGSGALNDEAAAQFLAQPAADGYRLSNRAAASAAQNAAVHKANQQQFAGQQPITLAPHFYNPAPVLERKGLGQIPSEEAPMTLDGSRLNQASDYPFYDMETELAEEKGSPPAASPGPSLPTASEAAGFWPEEDEAVVRTLAPTTERPLRQRLFPSSTQAPQRRRFPKDCAEVQRFREGRTNGLYQVFRPGCLSPASCGKEVLCDLETDGGGWTLVQQRLDDSVRFDRDWKAYADGFGDERNFWIGNSYLREVTSGREPYQLLVQLSDEAGNSIFALYEDFRLGPEEEDFRLHLGTMFGTSPIDNLKGSRNASFSTARDDPESCGAFWESGWWHQADCLPSGNLNVPYSTPGDSDDGILWQTELGFVRLATTQMKIRPTRFLE